jgi:hypothetical protein
LEFVESDKAENCGAIPECFGNSGGRQRGGLDAHVPSVNCMHAAVPNQDRRMGIRIFRRTLNKSKPLAAGAIAVWLGCACQVISPAQESSGSNWTSVDEACARYDNLRNRVLGNIGVRIDVNGPCADGFRRAVRYWNTVLAANFYEDKNLGACSVRIINGGPDILNHAMVARSQIIEWVNFQGKIAVDPGAAKEMNSAEIYGAAVHELGHMLGLKHNANIHSVMYFLDLDGTEGLDSKDVSDLRAHHQLRPAAISAGFLPIQTVQPERTSGASFNSRRVVQTLVRAPAPAQTGGFQ